MLKKIITYKEPFSDEERTEDFYFHLSRAELVELELSHDGGLSESLQRIIAASDGKGIVAEFKNLILASYGVRSNDGKNRFIKNQELRDEFESTEAYSVLFMELATDAGAATEFVNGIIPQDMVEEATAQVTAGSQPAEEEPKQAKRVVTPAEVEAMEPVQFAALKEEINAGKAMIKN